MKMMPPDVISHENQLGLQHLSEPSIFILDVFRTADHAGQIFIPHRHLFFYKRTWSNRPVVFTCAVSDLWLLSVYEVLVAQPNKICLTRRACAHNMSNRLTNCSLWLSQQLTQ